MLASRLNTGFGSISFDDMFASRPQLESIEEVLPKASILMIVINTMIMGLTVYVSVLASSGSPAIWAALAFAISSMLTHILGYISLTYKHTKASYLYAALMFVSTVGLALCTIVASTGAQERLQERALINISAQRRSDVKADPVEIAAHQSQYLSLLCVASVACLALTAMLLFLVVVVVKRRHFFEEISAQKTLKHRRFEERRRERGETARVKQYRDIRRDHNKARKLAREMSQQFKLDMPILSDPQGGDSSVADENAKGSGGSRAHDLNLSANDEMRTSRSPSPPRRGHRRTPSSFEKLPTVVPQFATSPKRKNLRNGGSGGSDTQGGKHNLDGVI